MTLPAARPGPRAPPAPAVSVVIPAYNTARTLGDTLRSVFAQSDGAFELILVDDGSTDALADALAPFASDPRLRLIRQENRGLARARNRGLADARAPLVAFLDADDLWHRDFLRVARAALDEAPAAPFAYALMIRIDAANRIVPTPPWRHLPRHDLVGLLEVNSVGNGSAALFRTGLLRDVGGFDSTLAEQGAEDWHLALRLAARAPPVLIGRQMIGYRIASDSMSRSAPDRQRAGVMAAMVDIRRRFPHLPARHFRNARTVMNGWLLPAFLATGRLASLPRLLVQSYLLNPLWFLSRDVRAVHLQKLASILQDRGPRQPIWEWREGGERPFAALAPDQVAGAIDQDRGGARSP